MSGFLVAVLIGCFVSLAPSHAAPKSEVWEYWTAHDPGSTVTIDHSAWDLFQTKYAYPAKDGIHRVAYSSVLDYDRKMLDQYIASLTDETVTRLSRESNLSDYPGAE